MAREIEREKILNDCYKIAVRYFDSPELILYGSRARGDSNASSDWDILVIVSAPVNRKLIHNFWDDIYELEIKLDQIIFPTVISRDEYKSSICQVIPFFQNILKDGYLYEARTNRLNKLSA
ncbi:MAG: nucleotidyltransferase domain-containing protein [Ignavibacteria bacterium]|nr:nucleotidyltransferase domain-containing protein [Ignavibacteria bacterium]